MEKSSIHRKIYIEEFGGDALNAEQIKYLKNTYGYQRCRLADSVEDFKREIKIAIKDNVKMIKNFFIRKNK